MKEAVTHVFRIIFQERLSGGYANVWWIVGHLTSGDPLAAPVSYARIDSLELPIRLMAYSLFALSVAWFCHSARSGVLPGAAVIFTYGMLALGVHENHPHGMILAFTATGLFSRRLQIAVGILSLTYVLNMLCLSGLGRFYGLRYMALEPAIPLVQRSPDELGVRFDVRPRVGEHLGLRLAPSRSQAGSGRVGRG